MDTEPIAAEALTGRLKPMRLAKLVARARAQEEEEEEDEEDEEEEKEEEEVEEEKEEEEEQQQQQQQQQQGVNAYRIYDIAGCCASGSITVAVGSWTVVGWLNSFEQYSWWMRCERITHPHNTSFHRLAFHATVSSIKSSPMTDGPAVLETALRGCKDISDISRWLRIIYRFTLKNNDS